MFSVQTLTRPRSLLIILILLLVARVGVLESIELTDPTETRYASIGQHMLETGNWLTPELPMAGGWKPYMGKPPLHFWMTALSMKVFGEDEWTARLPSAAMAVLILLCIFNLGRRLFDEQTAYLGTFITLSAPLFFMLSGASTTDMTLSACVTVSLWALIPSVLDGSKLSTQGTLIAALAAGAGFMTKGPVALVLIGLPLLIWCALRRDFKFFKQFPWLSSTALFLVVVTPWFWLSEQATPGFLKYFFWNENVARYLVKDYGDLYGTGHRYIRGTSWLMTALSFLPWTILIGFLLRREFKNGALRFFRDQGALACVLLAGLAPSIFFTLVRQLQPGYLLPSIPWLGLTTAALITKTMDSKEAAPARFFQYFSVLATVIAVGELGVGVWTGLSGKYLVLAILLVALIWFVGRSDNNGDVLSSRGTRSTLQICGLLFVGMFAAGPYLDNFKSTAPALQELIAQVPEKNPTVGVVSIHTYSHYWLASAWENELSEPVTIKYFSPEEIASGAPDYVLLKERDGLFSDPRLYQHYKIKGSAGRWMWLARKTPIPTSSSQQQNLLQLNPSAASRAS